MRDEQRFAALAERIKAEAGDTRSSEEVADGFRRIAIENMANAIKKISIQRGYDVSKYTLNCFGGAGGQHACDIADTLGMTRIFLHPFAGVLSAYGMGLADVRALRHRKGARGAVRVAGLTPWTRRNFARWLFEDYPRAQLVTPRRWHRRMLAGEGAYPDLPRNG